MEDSILLAIDEYHDKIANYTDKQKEYIYNLLGKYQEAIGGEKLDGDEKLFECMEEMLEKEIGMWSDVEVEDFNKIVYLCQDKIMLGEQHITFLKNYLSLSEISIRLNKEINDWGKISLFDFKKLMKNPNRFRLIPKSIPLYYEMDYEYGYQIYSDKPNYKMYYLRFYNLMMMDIDTNDINNLLEQLRSFVERGNFLFSIYKTYNGYHVFVLNRPYAFNDTESFILMKSLGCDHFYCLFSHKYGYNIRLNKKYNREEEFVSKHIMFFGDMKNGDPELLNLLKIHDLYLSTNDIPLYNNKYYNSYIDILKSEYLNAAEKSQYEMKLGNAKCRTFLINNPEVNKEELVVAIGKIFKSRICKPQQLIQDHEDFYLAMDLVTSTYYVCFKELMMIDWDIYKGTNDLDEKMNFLEKYCDSHPSLIFIIYKSQGGLHLFEASQPWDHGDTSTIITMLELKCDFYYIVYSYLRGWSIRLNKKEKEEENNNKEPLYKYYKTVGHGKMNMTLLKYIDLHLQYSTMFDNCPPSQMYGGNKESKKEKKKKEKKMEEEEGGKK